MLKKTLKINRNPLFVIANRGLFLWVKYFPRFFAHTFSKKSLGKTQYPRNDRIEGRNSNSLYTLDKTFDSLKNDAILYLDAAGNEHAAQATICSHCSNSETCGLCPQVFVLLGGIMHYMVYLDEFGHIGPFISRYDRQHKTSPIFGIAGIALPVEAVREFSMFFFKLKSRLLAFELSKASEHPARWEKKGSALYTVKNVTKYPEIHRATIRYLNKIKKLDGFIFHTGIEKGAPSPDRKAEGLYFSTLKDAVRRLSGYCRNNNCTFSLFLDSVDSDDGRKKFRNASVENTGRQMFADGCFCLVEPPYQLESHLYQTMQCADWICALFGRLFTSQCSTEYGEFEIFKELFEAKLNEVKACSSFKEKKALVRILKLPSK